MMCIESRESILSVFPVESHMVYVYETCYSTSTKTLKGADLESLESASS